MVRMFRQARTVQEPLLAPEPTVEAGAEFLERIHVEPAGRRRYRLYLPASLGDAPARGLVLMLHGCKQTPEDFAVGTGMNRLAEAQRLIVAYPGQSRSDNPKACWNWFRPGDQARGAGEPAILAGLAQALMAEHGIPAGRVFVAGLSAGGAMAAVLANAYPEVFAAVGAGRRAGAADRLPRRRRRGRASGQRRPAGGRGARVGCAACAPRHGERARLQPLRRARRGDPGARILGDRGRRARLVGREPRGQLRRPGGTGRLGGDGALLPGARSLSHRFRRIPLTESGQRRRMRQI
jgi:poly(3-hydroxybutyrate) depolymerase